MHLEEVEDGQRAIARQCLKLHPPPARSRRVDEMQGLDAHQLHVVSVQRRIEAPLEGIEAVGRSQASVGELHVEYCPPEALEEVKHLIGGPLPGFEQQLPIAWIVDVEDRNGWPSGLPRVFTVIG